jgi:hypothetical protein
LQFEAEEQKSQWIGHAKCALSKTLTGTGIQCKIKKVFLVADAILIDRIILESWAALIASI